MLSVVTTKKKKLRTPILSGITRPLLKSLTKKGLLYVK